MNRIIFSVFDKKSLLFGAPIVAPNTAVMFRLMSDEVRRLEPGNMLASHPSDFAVYLVGSFDDESGRILADAPTVVFECTAFVEAKP